MDSGPTATEAVLIALAGGLIGSLATGLIQLITAAFVRKRRRRVAARVFYGDIAVAEAAFNLAVQRQQWPNLLDFERTFEAWREFRADFAAGVTALEWTHVGAFYSNLERAARKMRPGQRMTMSDMTVAHMQVEYAEKALTVAAKHTAKRKKEQDEVIEELGVSEEEEDD